VDRRFSILVADENAECRRAFRDTLEPKGYAVVPARSGREVVHIVHREPVHVVVMDLQLPDYTGLEIYHAIKSIRAVSLPCIFTALEMNEGSLRDALGEGAVTILPKPVDSPRLVRAVNWSIDRYYARRRPLGRSGRELRWRRPAPPREAGSSEEPDETR
jgi:CheY-like chemotaxis protein